MSRLSKSKTSVPPIGSTIHHAAALGDMTMMKELLSSASQVSDLDTHGASPLHHACTNGKLLAVLFLLERGADINAATLSGLTPLMCAATNGHLPIVEELLTRKVNLLLENQEGLTASDLAHANYHNVISSAIDREMVQHVSVKTMEEAISKPDLVFLKYSLTFTQMDPNMICGDTQHTLLRYTCIQPNAQMVYRVVRYLLSRPKIEVNLRDKQGQTALLLAIQNPVLQVDTSALSLLLEFPSLDINLPDLDGMTALFHAICLELRPVIDLILTTRLMEIDFKHRDRMGRSMEKLAKPFPELLPYINEKIATLKMKLVTK